jgi:hypothetical protein
LKFFDELLPYFFAGIKVAGIKSRLAATGLFVIVIHSTSHTLQ